MKLSIITINYNNAAGLKKTLDSVASQTCSDFEHIIVDGASSDDSVDIIRAYSQSPIANRHKIIWLSEPDTGIYNAMNKGVRIAKGEYTLMLNSGDYLVGDNIVEKVLPLLDGTDIIQGNRLELVDGNLYRNRGYGKSDISYFDIIKGHFLHQASFCRKLIIERCGFFDERYRIVGDTKFFMKSLDNENASFEYVDLDICNYDMNGISSGVDSEWVVQHEKEEIELREELYSHRLLHFFYENDKKIRLYDKLHKHKWVWYFVMCITHIYDWLYLEENDVKRSKI